MKIYYNDKVLEIEVNDNSYRYRAIKGEHTLTLYFSLPQHVEIPIGAYCAFEAEAYTLEAPENVKMHNSRNFEYTLIMESAQAKLKKYKLRNIVDKRLKFSITAKPKEHIKMIVDNLNKRDSGWEVGECVTATEKDVAFNHAFCDAALSQIADAFETEWEVVGKKIHLHKVEYNKDNPLPLSYGRGNGFLPGVGRSNFSNTKSVEVLFVQGGDKNIDTSKYGSSSLLLPKSQTLSYDGKYFEDEDGFNTAEAHTYISDAEGASIQRQDKELRSKEEDSLDLSHIYPLRVGTVSGVEVTMDEYCNFFDKTIPADLNFNDYLVGGEAVSIIFQSGQLAGKEFDANYVHAYRRFELKEQTIDSIQMPKGAYMPVVGDKYAVFNILLPERYVTEASWNMFREAVKYLYENEGQKFTFTGELDGIWAKKDWLNIGGRIKLGGYVLFSDPQFQPEGIGIRIVGIKDYINNPHSPEIELSNSVVGSSIMSDIRKIESNEVLTESQHKEALQFTKRRFRDAEETTKMLENALLENFSQSINPISVHAMQLMLGDESLQYCFVASKTNPTPITHEAIYTQQTKVLTAEAGILQHLTLGINTLSSSHKAREYKYWDMSAFTSPTLTDPSKGYYLYAKVNIGNTAGEFYLSEKAIKMEEIPGYYHLLYGVLNSEHNQERSFAPMYGFAELTPGRLTIPMIASPDGRTYFNIAEGEIGGEITFRSTSGKMNKLAGTIDDIQSDISKIPAYVLDLSNENASIPCTSDGVPETTAKYPTSTASLFYGTKLCSDGVFSAVAKGIKALIDPTTGVITLSDITEDSATVVVVNSLAPDVKAVMTISKVRGGVKGEDAVVINVYSSSGTATINGNIDILLTAQVFKGAEDISENIAPSLYSWKRISANTLSDAAWNKTKEGVGRTIRIGNADITRTAMFECLAVVDGVSVSSIIY